MNLDEANAKFQRAAELARVGRLEEAAALHDELLAIFPNHGQLLGEAGTVALRRGKTDSGVVLLRRAVVADPSRARIWSHLGAGIAAQGHWTEAIACYDRAIDLRPDYADALINRGHALFHLSRWEEALTCYEQGLSHSPLDVEASFFHARTLQLLRRYPQALAALDHTISLAPDHPEALVNRANVLLHLGRPQDALASCDLALRATDDLELVHLARGNALTYLNRPDDALISFDRALAVAPKLPEAHDGRGIVLRLLGRLEQSLASHQRALELAPNNARLQINLGLVQRDLGDLNASLASFQLALTMAPELPTAHLNCGVALRDLGRLSEALASFQHAIALAPDRAEAHVNCGLALKDLGELSEAEACYNRAISLAPDHPAAHWNLAFLKLLMGDFEQGWRLYEWRWRDAQKADRRSFSQPLWLGDESIAGKTLLIHPEQGLGDFIQFSRYAIQVCRLGAKVILETPAPLLPLMESLRCDLTLIEAGKPRPDFDLHTPIASLPLALRTTPESIPEPDGYLHVDPEHRQRWRELLGEARLPRIGLAWSGARGHKNDRWRSIPLRALEPLLRMPFEFHVLQKDIRPDDQETLDDHPRIVEHGPALNDFADTAALIEAMDLVITVDTSIAHLSGALSHPIWLLLPHAPDYRWMLGSDQSPWYRSMQLMRQPAAGDWASVIRNVAEHCQHSLLGLQQCQPSDLPVDGLLEKP